MDNRDLIKQLLKDADFLYNEAIEELNRGKLRNAAEKAWGAALRAVNALIVERTGVEPERTPDTTIELHKLAGKDEAIDENRIVDRYHTRADFLHGQCFYTGLCEPRNQVERRIKETVNFIDDVRKLCNRTKKSHI